MLPRAVAYGACTNRLFLVAAALGCTSVHQRNDDADFQVLDGRKVCPIHHELLSLGRPAGEAAAVVTRSELDPADADKPVVLVGGSFIGEQSADVSEIRELDPAVHHEVVRLWAPPLWSEEEQDAMVAVRGADILLRLLGYGGTGRGGAGVLRAAAVYMSMPVA